MEDIIEWLVSGPAFVEYRTRLDILGQSVRDERVIGARERMFEEPKIMGLINELRNWPGYPIKRHNDAKHPLHKLVFISEIGLNREDEFIDEIAEKVIEGSSDEGPVGLDWQLYKRWMGKDGIETIWAMCDAPLIHYSLIRLGYGDDERVMNGTKFLLSRVRDNGWRCGASEKLKNFKGPGDRESLCPYATLVMMRLISACKEIVGLQDIKKGGEALLQRWDLKGTEKPFLFGIGTNFMKLKVPMIWYDILHMTEVLTRFERFKEDPRVEEMKKIIEGKNVNGRYVPESIWMAWKGWDLGQKREPSKWLTYRVLNMLQK